MPKVKFIKTHPSKRFKKGETHEIPNESLQAWINSGYIEVESDGGDLGKVEATLEVANTRLNSANGGKSQKKSGSKKKRKNKK